jgi:cell wall assembly regulator SMI1
MALADHLAEIESWLAALLPATHERLAPGLSDPELATVSQQLGGALAPDLAALWAWHGGQWPDPPADAKPEPRPWLADCYALYELMLPADAVANKTKLDRYLASGRFDTPSYTTKYAWNLRWFPFARAGNELLVLDLAGDYAGVAGQVLRVDLGASERHIVAPSLEALLAHQVRMICAGGLVVVPDKDGVPGKPSIVSRRWTPDPDHPRYPLRKRIERNARPPPPLGAERALFAVLEQRMSSSEVEAALALGARLDLVDDGGSTPLHLAVQCPTTHPAEAMLRAGAAVDARDVSGRTPLSRAVELGSLRRAVDMVRVLMAAGADPDCADDAGTTPRVRAAQRFQATSRGLVLAALAVRPPVGN